MTLIDKRDGLTLIEILIILAVIGVLLAMGGSLASKFASYRSVDRVTTSISSTLQFVKLKAARQGLEYQAVLTFDPDAETLTIVTQRGNSNRGSDNYEDETSLTISVVNGVTVSPVNRTINFNPNGTLGGASGTIRITPSTDTKIKRCGRVVVSPFGRIRVVQGNWKSSPPPGVCCPIYDSPPGACEPGCTCPE
jgi:Tfp pilus assembly protein FimT